MPLPLLLTSRKINVSETSARPIYYMPTKDENITAGERSSHAAFLSYNREDREAVEKVAVHLEDNADLKPWFDRWTLVPGESRLGNLYRGLEASYCCAVFVGQSGKGPWEKQEISEAIQSQVSRNKYRVIPVLLPEAATRPELPHFFINTTWVDLRRGIDDDDALWRLECGIRGIAPGRGRPEPQQQERAPAQQLGDDPLLASNIDVPKAANPVSVFVSYRHQEPDQSVAHALAEALGRAGHEVFIDTGIRWGGNWVSEINYYLEKAHYFLLLLSKDSAASEMVVEELVIARELARKKGAPVILPLRLSLPFDAPLPYQVAAYLRSIQQEQWSQPDDTTRIIERLLNVIAERARWAADEAQIIETSASVAKGDTRAAILRPQIDPREMIMPGGALAADSRFYILRQADEEVYKHVMLDRGLVTIRGPRQTGKTSLMVSTCAALRIGGEELRAAFVDFQSFPLADLSSIHSIWHAIANHISRQFKFGGWDADCWKPGMDHDEGFERFLERCVFADDERPILICLDEVDRVFLSPIKDEFFGTLRSFYNDGAINPNSRRVRWLLGTSSEPSFFIRDLTQSPFNIGQRVNLNVFTHSQTEALARRHGLEIDASMLHRVMNYLGGQPYLVHLFFYHLAGQPDSAEQLFDSRAASGGIFRDHLHRFLMHFHHDAPLAKAMLRVTQGEFETRASGQGTQWLARAMRLLGRGKGRDGLRLANRLEAGGLARRDDEGRLVPLCGLYAEFFSKNIEG